MLFVPYICSSNYDMRYRGVMFRSKHRDGFAICIPYIGNDGDDHLAPIHEVSGWENMEVESNELLVAEFVLSDGSVPMTFGEYLKVAGKTNDECNIYVKSVVVAKTKCVMDVEEILKSQPSTFAGLCVEQVLEASRTGMFDEDILLSQWKKLGYDRSQVGESVELAAEPL